MNVDKNKWERIAFETIESQDTLLVVRHSSIDYITPGTLEGVVGTARSGSWIIAGWPVEPTTIHDLIIYRKRPDFVMPTTLGSVITAEDRSGTEYTFVFADPNPKTDLPWYGSDEEWYGAGELLDAYVGHMVVSEGVKLPEIEIQTGKQ